MALELSLPYQLRTSDFDRNERIKPSSVLDIFQDIAAIQAEEMGIGYERMMSEGVFWAVARTKFEIVRNPAMHSVAVARTWPHSPSRLIFHRDYSLKDAEGSLLVKATSEWMLMDVETRSLASVVDHCDVTEDYCEDRAFEGKVKRVKPFDPDESTFPAATIVPQPGDVDPNGHVNNACYAAYVLNAIDLGDGDLISTFQIDYRQDRKSVV